jgi:hypothetical protein
MVLISAAAQKHSNCRRSCGETRAFLPLKNGLGSNISEETLVCPKNIGQEVEIKPTLEEV